MWSAWLSIHSPQYRSRRSARVAGSTCDAEQVLERVDRAHLVGDRADAADARDDVEDLVRRAADDERLEVARRLEDLRAAPRRPRRRGRAGAASPRPRRGSGSGPGSACRVGGRPGAVTAPCIGAAPSVVAGRSDRAGRRAASMTARNGGRAAVKPREQRGRRPSAPADRLATADQPRQPAHVRRSRAARSSRSSRGRMPGRSRRSRSA